jgi:diaminohydroxyphosphoribosylaminopyrimidine deaminase / 5-amino-6-(5-phosphoribosylamino)uracil reductase
MDGPDPETWRRLLRRSPADAGLSPLYGPLLAAGGSADHPGDHAGDRSRKCPGKRLVLGRVAQSLDGRIATSSGASRWISGPDDIAHTHRLRALFDAVVVGCGTVRADDPLLTTRVVEGPSPVRVVLDPRRRLDARYQLFQDGPETLLLCAEDAPGPNRLGHTEVVRLPYTGDMLCPDASLTLCPNAILATLAARGLHRVFVEGGGVTVSRFLAAGALDRLHVTIAPLLLGDGVAAFRLPPPASLADALRFDWTVHRLGADLLLDIALPGRCGGPAPA